MIVVISANYNFKQYLQVQWLELNFVVQNLLQFGIQHFGQSVCLEQQSVVKNKSFILFSCGVLYKVRSILTSIMCYTKSQFHHKYHYCWLIKQDGSHTFEIYELHSEMHLPHKQIILTPSMYYVYSVSAMPHLSCTCLCNGCKQCLLSFVCPTSFNAYSVYIDI